MSELVYRRPCEHNFYSPHWKPMHSDWDCPGGVEIVLDPERVLLVYSGEREFQVQDVLDVLDEETE